MILGIVILLNQLQHLKEGIQHIRMFFQIIFLLGAFEPEHFFGSYFPDIFSVCHQPFEAFTPVLITFSTSNFSVSAALFISLYSNASSFSSSNITSTHGVNS